VGHAMLLCLSSSLTLLLPSPVVLPFFHFRFSRIQLVLKFPLISLVATVHANCYRLATIAVLSYIFML
jgi:hypothetical protein